MNEFAINWLKGADYAEVSAPSGSALKSKLMSLAEKYPEDVTNIIINKDGSIFCHIPVAYVKVSHPKRISEEQKEAAAERFRKMRQKMKLYDVYDNGKYIGAFTTNEASKIIGYKEPRYISSKTGTGKLAFNRFLIEKTGDFTLSRKKDQKLLEDFDYITGIIKNV